MTKFIIDANKARCFELLNHSFINNPNDRVCRPNFDSSLCWEEANAGGVVGQDCPFKFCTYCTLRDEERKVTRHCFSNGTWSEPNYSQCVFIYENTTCIEKNCSPCADPFRQMIMSVTLGLSIISVITLVMSVSLFSFLRSIQCRRLTIHANLALAFVLRFSTYTVWILLQKDQVLQGCGEIMRRETGDWLCKIILFIIMYSTLASTFWMFVEGAYLVSRFSIYAMRATDGPLWLYLLVGWTLPLICVSSWALAHQLQGTEQFCWMPFTTGWPLWFVVGPMSAALILNVLFLIVVIGVVIQKMRTAGSNESTKLWQTIKATLLLVPLLGVSNLLLFYEPSERETMAYQIYLLVTAALQHSQGIFVAILYCFANSEVQFAIKRELKKFSASRQVPPKKASTRSFFSSAEYSVVSGTDADQNELTPKRKNSKSQRRFLNVGKIKAASNEIMKRKLALTADLPLSTPFVSKYTNSTRPHYESCIIYTSNKPKVVITAPND